MDILYTVHIFDGGNRLIAAATKAARFTWNDGKATNSIYATAADMVKNTDTAVYFRVYPVNDTLLALRCGKTAAAVAANKGGKAAAVKHGAEGIAVIRAAAKASRQTKQARNIDTQEIISRELRIITARLAAAMADGLTDIESYVLSAMAAANHHTQDFFSVCILAAAENRTATAAEKAAAIYKAANAWTYANKTARAKEVSTEYITTAKADGGAGCNIISIGTAIGRIVRGDEKYCPSLSDTMDTDTAARLAAAIASGYELLSPAQQKIVIRLCPPYNYSVDMIATATGTDKATAARQIMVIRRTIAGHIEKTAAEFMPIIAAATAAAEKAAATKAATDKKAAAARRQREKDGTAEGKTAAERMKEYRARKKAAAMAATAAKNV